MPAASISVNDTVIWRSAIELGIRGKAPLTTDSPYHRLPSSVHSALPKEERLWMQIKRPAGMHVDFISDARDIFVKWSMAESIDVKDTCTSLARAGLDCYGRDSNGRWRWVGVKEPCLSGLVTREFILSRAPTFSAEIRMVPLTDHIQMISGQCGWPMLSSR